MDHQQYFPHLPHSPLLENYRKDLDLATDLNQDDQKEIVHSPDPHARMTTLDPVGSNYHYLPGLTPLHSHTTTDRTAQLQLQLSRIENFTDGLNLPPLALWQDEPVSMYQGEGGGGDLAVGIDPVLIPYSDGFPSPRTSGFGVSLSSPCSSTSTTTSLGSDGSLSPRSNYCWGSTVPMYPQMDNGFYQFHELDGLGYPVTREHSAASCEAQNCPDLQADLHGYEYNGFAASAGGGDNGSKTVDSSNDSNNNTATVDNDSKNKPSTQTPPTKYGRISRRSKSGRPSPNRIVKRRRALSLKSTTATTTNTTDKDCPSPSSSYPPLKPTRVFICSFSHYGCQSTFVSKNEWKRHITSQHLQLGFYRCDVGSCNSNINTTPSNSPSPNPNTTSCESRRTNDFNRKDLFTQHQRRMHAPWLRSGQRQPSTEKEREVFEQSLEEVRQRCWHEQRRPPPQSRCGFCGVMFSGPRSWDERMEHVGRHFERGDVRGTGKREKEDVLLRNWAVQEGIVVHVDVGNGDWRLASLVEK